MRTNAIFAGFTAVGLAVGSIVFGGWVMSWLWAWFVVPLGVTQIGVAHAVGLMVVARCLTGFADLTQPSDEEWIAELVARGFAAPAITLGMGAIIASLMN
jgi:hypothetical protein